MNHVMYERQESINRLLSHSEPFRVRYTETFKNNIEAAGYCLVAPKRDCSPLIYFDDWCEGSDEEIVSFLTEQFDKYSLNNVGTVKDFLTSGNVLDQVLPKVVSAENIPSLEKNHILFCPVLNMAVTFYCPIEMPGLKENKASVTLTKQMLSYIGKNEVELFFSAIRNAEADCVIRPMNELITELGMNVSEFENDLTMYVITNKSRMYGASLILSKKLMEKLKQALGTFVILPSSIHEIIAVPCKKESDLAFLAQMVEEINASEVDPSDRLTDSIYLWKDNRLQVWENSDYSL
ncbi:MAG: hypothetical protein IJT16_09130 [Lachnospiraceae bacterium]|nr:hypothetical protein [Lachnospiraceae bacterium]